jgi:hypothetical protein
VESNSDRPQLANMFNGATTTVYIKNKNHRTELVNTLGSTSTIFDGKTNTAVVLKEYGAQKILVRMTAQNWIESNKKYEGTVFTKTAETKTIAGWNCTKYTGKMADNSEFTVFSTNQLSLENKDYNAQFKNAGGLVLEYSFTMSNGLTITNTASKLIQNTVSDKIFDIPKSGYREMTYEEMKKNN